MAGLSSVGVGSGLDIAGLVERLVAAERAPVQGRLDRKEAGAQAELSAYGLLKSNLTTLDDALKGLTTTGSGRTAVSADPDKLGAVAASNAVAGRYGVKVTQLAAAHALASSSYSGLTNVVGTGTLTFDFGTTLYNPATDTYTSFTPNPTRPPRTLTIDATNNTVEKVRDAINAANLGVSAVVVNDGVGYRLLLTSSQSGAATSLRVTVSGDGGSGLQNLAFNGSATNLEQTVTATDALLTINGLNITSPSNKVDKAIEGVTFELRTLSAAQEIQVDVDFDRGASIKAADAFVAAYNTLLEQMRELTKFNPETGQGAVLAGDGAARSVTAQLRDALLTPVSSLGAYRYLVDVGVRTNSSGKLEVDSAKLSNALNADFGGVSKVLEQAAKNLKNTVTSLTQSDGLIDARTDGLNARIDDIEDQRIRLEDRMATVEARLLKQFTALDTLLGQLQSTSAFLTQQLANIPVPGRHND